MSIYHKRAEDFGRPVRWDRQYARFFPMFTDGCSRHVKVIAHDCLRSIRSPVRTLLADADYDPDHWAQSMEITVLALWRARREIRRLREKYEPDALAQDDAAERCIPR